MATLVDAFADARCVSGYPNSTALLPAEWDDLSGDIDEVNALCGDRKKNVIQICLKLSRMRRRLAHRKWITLIRSGEIKLKKSAADQHRRSGDTLETVRDHFYGRLPSRSTALHEICKLPSELIEQLIIEEQIKEDLSPKAAAALVRKHLGRSEDEPEQPNLPRRLARLEECLDWLDTWPEDHFQMFDQRLEAMLERARQHRAQERRRPAIIPAPVLPSLIDSPSHPAFAPSL